LGASITHAIYGVNLVLSDEKVRSHRSKSPIKLVSLMNICASLESGLLINTPSLGNKLVTLWYAFEKKMLQVFSLYLLIIIFDWWDLARLAKIWKKSSKYHLFIKMEVWYFSQKYSYDFTIWHAVPTKCHRYPLYISELCEYIRKKLCKHLKVSE